MIWRFAMLATLFLVAACAHARETSAPVTEGRRMFQEQGCYGCHTIGKTGTPIGPDLSHIGTKHNQSYLIGWLRDPSLQRPTAHIAEDPAQRGRGAGTGGLPRLAAVKRRAATNPGAARLGQQVHPFALWMDSAVGQGGRLC
jgi:hypothetical protein